MDPETTQKITMDFLTDANTKVTLTAYDTASAVDAEQVSTAMDTIIAQNVLQDSQGNLVTLANTAQRITTTKQILF